MSSYPPNPSYPPSSASHAHAPAQYPPYPYPGAYPPAPYGPYAPYAPYGPYAPYPSALYAAHDAAMANAPLNAAEVAAANARGRRYRIIFASVTGSVTLLALLLAIIAPNLGLPAGALTPAGWSQVYQSDLTAPTAKDYQAWDLTKGCAFYTTGLDANGANGAGDSSGEAICDFKPAGVGADTSQGFSLELSLTPAANVASFQESSLMLGDDASSTGNRLYFQVGQDGSYRICDAACQPGQGIYIRGATAAWHGDAWVANSFAARVSATHTEETFYINGQQVADVTLDLGARPALAVGAPDGSETIFTAVRFSTGA